MKTNNTSSQLFFLAVKGIELMQNFKFLSNNGKFEVLLFNSEIALDTFRSNKPDYLNHVQNKYFEYLEDYIRNNNISGELSDIEGFINNRFVFYANELNKIFSPTYIPGAIYNAFYETPFCLKPEFNFDIPNMILFSIPLKNMAKYVNNEVNQICKLLD